MGDFVSSQVDRRGLLRVLGGLGLGVCTGAGAGAVGLSGGGLCVVGGTGGVCVGQKELRGVWGEFWRRHGRVDGRVVDDYGSKEWSKKEGKEVEFVHTEGLGVGLLGAEAVGDEVVFGRIWGWLERLRRVDGLHSWGWVSPVGIGGVGVGGRVVDENNAVDGDLYIALACWRVSKRGGVWCGKDMGYWRGMWESVMGGVLRGCVEDMGELVVRSDGRDQGVGCVRGGRWLLGGVRGFREAVPGGVVLLLNPAYWVFEVFDVYSREGSWEGGRVLSRGLVRSGEWLLGECLRKWGVVPDWVEGRVERAAVKGGEQLGVEGGGILRLGLNGDGLKKKEDRVGYEAVRVVVNVGSGAVSSSVRERVVGYFRERLKSGSAAVVGIEGGVGGSYESEWKIPVGFEWVGAVPRGRTSGGGGGEAVVKAGGYFDGYLVLLGMVLPGR